MNYKNLDTLLQENEKAQKFFHSLTEPRQHQVQKYNEIIHSYRELRLYGELLLQGGFQ